jgi:hypothetical protein
MTEIEEIQGFCLPLEKAALSPTAALAEAAARVDRNPSEGQKESGNYRKGHLAWKGLELTIETPAGAYRSGVGADGTPWRTLMRDHYGYIKRTLSQADKDHVDVFLTKDDLSSEIVFVVNQYTGKRFDEHKCVLGCTSAARAKEVYKRNYERGWDGFGSMAAMTIDQFKRWLTEGDTGKPARDLKTGFGKAKAAGDEANRLRVDEDTDTDADGDHMFRSKGASYEDAAYTPLLFLVKRAKDADTPFTVAIDLDGTLAEVMEPFDPETIGPVRERTRYWANKFHDAGARVVVFTVRGDEDLVAGWLDENDVKWDFINENPDQPEGSSGKVIADAYWDDRAHNAEDPDEHGPLIEKMIEAHGAEGGLEETTPKGDKKEPNLSVTVVRNTTLIFAAPDLLEAMEGDDDRD